jgi:hypothetical protein
VGAGHDAVGTGKQGVVPQFIGGAKDDRGAIGREDRGGAEVALDLEGHTGARNNGRVNGRWRFLLGAEKQNSDGGKKSQGGDGPRK